MSKSCPTPSDIQKWVPSRLMDFIGCEEAKATLVDHLRADGDGANVLILGETGTGKTGLVEAYVRTRNCPASAGPLLGPCGVCEDCRLFDFEHQDAGLFPELRASTERRVRTHFFHINCYAFGSLAIAELIKDIGFHHPDRCIVYLDEVHCLANDGRDLLLLKALRELRAIWIATGIDTEGLSPMFVRRFATRCKTTLPSVQDLALFLVERCEEWSIRCDHPGTIVLLAQRSQQITAECIGVLACAAGREGRLLDRQLVEDYLFITGVTRLHTGR